MAVAALGQARGSPCPKLGYPAVLSQGRGARGCASTKELPAPGLKAPLRKIKGQEMEKKPPGWQQSSQRACTPRASCRALRCTVREGPYRCLCSGTRGILDPFPGLLCLTALLPPLPPLPVIFPPLLFLF